MDAESEKTRHHLFNEALLAIYDAAMTPELWPVALSRLGKIFGAEGSVIIFYSGVTQADFITCDELRPAVELYQTEEWWRQDLHAQRAIAQNLSLGDVFSDLTVATPDEIETHPIYVDFFRKVGFGWLMSGVILPDLDVLVGLSVPRAKEKGPFRSDEIELLASLSRHVEQSLRISIRISNLEASEAVMTSAVNAMDACIFALDAERRMIFGNTSGLACLENFFVSRDGRLYPREDIGRAHFDAVLQSAGNCNEQDPPGSCVIGGLDGRRMAVWALPVTNSARWLPDGHDAAKTLLFATPVDREHTVDPTVIRDIFALSLGEARLAALVGGGMNIRQVAERLGIAEGTARVVLNRVFGKLGINRQTQLVQQLANLGQFSPLRGGPRVVRAR